MAQKPGFPQQVPPAEYPQQVPPTGYAQQVPPYPMDPPPAYTYADGEGTFGDFVETPHVSEDVNKEIFDAAANGDVRKCIEILKRSEADVNAIFNITALQAASRNGHIEIINLLLLHNANVEVEDNDGNRAVHYASYGDEPGVMEQLDRAGAHLNARNKRRQTPLHIAVEEGNLVVATSILKLRCLPSLQDSEGDTPLHYAISRKRDEMIILLLDNDADICLTNNDGYNALQLAARRGYPSAMRILLSKLPEPCVVHNTTDELWSPLHLAVLNKDPEVAELLLQEGKAYTDVTNLHQQTPLHLAVEHQRLCIVKLLVDKKCRLNIPDEDGNTPLHRALHHHTLSRFLYRKLTDMQEGLKVGVKATMNCTLELLMEDQVNQSWEKLGNAAYIAIYLSCRGANLNVKNKDKDTPLDLCSDDGVYKVLNDCHNCHKKQPDEQCITPSNTSPSQDNESLEECMVCSNNKRDTLFGPCGHIATCSVCSPRVKKCLTCKEQVQSRIKVEECVVCSDKKASVLFQPCGHMCACDNCALLMKKCVQCRAQIDKVIPFIVCCGGTVLTMASLSILQAIPSAPSPTPESGDSKVQKLN